MQTAMENTLGDTFFYCESDFATHGVYKLQNSKKGCAYCGYSKGHVHTSTKFKRLISVSKLLHMKRKVCTFWVQ